MKTAVLTLAYNEEETIGAVLKNWQGKVYRHLVLHTDKPWHGQELPPDRTEEIVKSFQNTEFIRLPWRSETEQRNWGLAYLYDYDYVLIVDADELYLEKDQEVILRSIGVKNRFEDNQWCYRCPKIITYYKNTNYVFDPPDRHEPVIAVDPKKVLFVDCRIPQTQYLIPLDVEMHHLSYAKSDSKIRDKIQHFEHYDQVEEGWFENNWKKWTPESGQLVRPYGVEKSRAVYKPAPKEIIDLLS